MVGLHHVVNEDDGDDVDDTATAAAAYYRACLGAALKHRSEVVAARENSNGVATAPVCELLERVEGVEDAATAAGGEWCLRHQTHIFVCCESEGAEGVEESAAVYAAAAILQDVLREALATSGLGHEVRR
eukprot:SAG11_NODE_175_length_13457_cov_42.095673_9_plen_130_part_00